MENVPPSFLKLNLSPPAPGGAEIPETISAAPQPACARGPGIGAEVINSAARRCGGSRREGGNPGSHGPFRWVGRSRWGAPGGGGRGGCGLNAPSGFLGGGFFEGSGGSPGKGGSGEEVGAWRGLTLRFQRGPPHSRTGPQTHSLRTPPRQSRASLSSRQKTSLLQALQASNSSAAAPLAHVAQPAVTLTRCPQSAPGISLPKEC